jgi:hypothetical protein
MVAGVARLSEGVKESRFRSLGVNPRNTVAVSARNVALEAVDPLLTIKVRRQLVATGSNGFGVIRRISARSYLPPIASGCDRWAP